MIRSGSTRSKAAAVAVTAVIAAAALSFGTASAHAAVRTVTSESTLNSAVQTSSEGDTIELDKSIKLSEPLEIPEGKVLDIRGKTGKEKLTISLPSYSAALKSGTKAVVMVSGSVNVSDLIIDAEGHMRAMYIGGGGQVVLDSGAGVINGLAGKTETYGGAGIRMQGSSSSEKTGLVIRTGAYISGNKAEGSVREGISGIGVSAAKYADIQLDGGIIENNTDATSRNYMYFSNGGGIALAGTGTSLTINSGEIRNNTVKGSGGGISAEVTSEPVRIKGGTISSNTAYTSGGGIYAGASEVIMSGGSISGNSTQSNNTNASYAQGGGVYVSGRSSETSDEAVFRMSGGSITGNTAMTRAASNQNDPQNGQGGGIMTYGRFVMSGGSITGNSALSSKNLSGEAAAGGGISIGGGNYPGTAVISGGSITGNRAQNCGGGIYVNDRNLEQSMMSGDTEDIPQTPGAGNLEVSGSVTVKSNTGSGGDGNIYLTEDSLVTVADEIDSSSELRIGTEVTTAGTVIGTAAAGYDLSASDTRRLMSDDGRRIYSNHGSDIIVSEENDGKYQEISGAEIRGIEASYTYTGQTIRPEPEVVLNGKKLVAGTDYTLSYRMTGHDNVNVSSGDTVAIVRVIGSGAYSGTVKKEFRIAPADITAVQARKVSDRIYTGRPIEPKVRLFNGKTELEEGKDYTLDYSGNTDPGDSTAEITVTGKGNYTGKRSVCFTILPEAGAKLASSSSELVKLINDSSGTEEDPEAIYIMNDIEMSETLEIPERKYVKLSGGGENNAVTAVSRMDQLINVAGYLELADITLDAASKGRVMKITDTGYVRSGDGTVMTNGIRVSATDNKGGAIYSSGRFTAVGGKISSCTAGLGGALFNSSKGIADLSDIRIEDNTATIAGGGVYNEGSMTAGSGTEISRNKAKLANTGTASGAGGGIYTSGSTVCGNGSEISGNTAESTGAGIYSSGSTELKEGCSIADNTTSGTSSSRVRNCGGGIYISGGTVVMNGGSITGNRAVSKYVEKNGKGSLGNGGGVCVSNSSSGAEFVMNDGRISGNTASGSMKNGLFGNGGGIYVTGGRNNDNSEGYGSTPGRLTLNGGTVTSNRASGSGSGICVGNRETYAYNNGYSSASYKGAAECSMSGEVRVSDNHSSNLYLAEDTYIRLTGNLTSGAKNVGLTAEAGGTVTVASGRDYVPDDDDAGAFYPDAGLRTIKLDSSGNIRLKAVDLSDAGFEVETSGSEFVFTGSEIKPEVTVKGKDSSRLTEGRDYELEYSGTGISSKALVNVGEKTVTATGKGEYEGAIEAVYKVVPVSMRSVNVKFSTQVYTGRKLTPNPSSIKYGSYSLLKGSDYKAAYKNNVSAGAATVTISGRGNFSGTKTVSFNIRPKKMTAPKLKSLKKGQLKASWKKDSQATGYQIVAARNSRFTSGRKTVNVSGSRTVSKTVSGLKSGSRYYVRIRAYKTIKGVKYYGSYSSTVKIKVKSR